MIIVNIGSPASGKSTLSTALATEILKKQNSCILISLDTNIPHRALWESSRKVQKMYSVGNVFDEVKIDSKTLPKYILTHEKYKNLGLLGYVAGDTPMEYPEPTYDQILALISAAEQLVDYVIVDCSSELLIDSTGASIEMADCLNVSITPNPKGLLYLKTLESVYGQNPKYIVSNTNYILSPINKWNDAEAMKKLIEKNNIYKIKYDVNIDEENTSGDMFNIVGVSKSYRKTVNKLLDSCKNKVQKQDEPA